MRWGWLMATRGMWTTAVYKELASCERAGPAAGEDTDEQMSCMSDIPICAACTFPSLAPSEPLSPAGVAVLAEIERFLEDYRIRGRGGVINLGWARLVPGDLERLREILGTGGASVTIAALGGSSIQETAIPCVWWLSHRSGEDRLTGHWIEIAEVPALLRGDRTSISPGLDALRERAATLGGAGYPFARDGDIP